MKSALVPWFYGFKSHLVVNDQGQLVKNIKKYNHTTKNANGVKAIKRNELLKSTLKNICFG